MQRLCLRVNCSIAGRIAVSRRTATARTSDVTYVLLQERSGPLRAFCATVGAETDPCKVLVQRHLEPLHQQRSQVCKQIEDIEKQKRSVEASISDCCKKIAAANEQTESQKVKEGEQHNRAQQLREQRDELVVERDAQGKEYSRKVEEVGFDEAEKRLEEIRARPSVQQRGPLLQKYADLHRSILEHEKRIKEAEAAAIKANQIASDVHGEKEKVQAKQVSLMNELRDLEGQLVDGQTALEEVKRKINQAKFQGARLRKSALWAQKISPFIVPSVDNLPMLVLQRHQAIQTAAAGLNTTSSRVLLDLECAAEELEHFPGIEVRLKASGYSAMDLWNMNFSLLQLKYAGFSASELLQMEGVGTAELKERGFTAQELNEAGVGAKQLHDIGFTANELKKAGFTALALINANFTAGQLRSAGFNAVTLRKANLSAADLKEGGFSISDLHKAAFTPADLRRAGFDACKLREEGLSAIELMEAGFAEEELVDAGYDRILARAAHMRSHGASAVELLASKAFTVSQLKDAGWGKQELAAAMWKYAFA